MDTISQAVLLAAGKGTRLLPRTAQVPKCMVEVGGRALVDQLIEGLLLAGVRELVVVTGYREERLRAHLGTARGPMKIRYVDSPDYATTNNIVSLHRALPLVRAPFYLLESDVWAPPSLVGRLAPANAMAVAPYTEGMDGTGVIVGSGDRVDQMLLRAHEIRARPQGLMKTVNFYSISRTFWEDHFAPALSAAVQAGRTGDYYESVLIELVSAGYAAFRAVDVSDAGWVEIDNLDDLARAEGLAARP